MKQQSVLTARTPTPWLVAAVFMAAKAVAMWFAPFVPALGPMFSAYARVPLGLTASAGIAAGIAAGALAGWLGWRAGGGARRVVAKAV